MPPDAFNWKETTITYEKPTQVVFTVIANKKMAKIYRFEDDAQKAVDDLLDLGVSASYREDVLN